MSRRAIRVAAPPSSAEEHWHLLLPEGFRFDDEGDSLEHETATIGSRTIVLREHITRLRAGDDVDQGQTEEGPVGPPPDMLHLHVKRDYPQTAPGLRPKPTSDPPASAVSYTTVFYPPIMPTALFSASAVLENDGVDSKDGRHGDKQCSGISPFTLLQAAILVRRRGAFPAPAGSLLMALREPTARYSTLSVRGRDLRIRPAAPVADSPNPAEFLGPPIVPLPRDRLTERAHVHR